MNSALISGKINKYQIVFSVIIPQPGVFIVNLDMLNTFLLSYITNGYMVLRKYTDTVISRVLILPLFKGISVCLAA